MISVSQMKKQSVRSYIITFLIQFFNAVISLVFYITKKFLLKDNCFTEFYCFLSNFIGRKHPLELLWARPGARGDWHGPWSQLPAPRYSPVLFPPQKAVESIQGHKMLRVKGTREMI